MEYRTLGRTGLEVSTLGFGCGAVGGLLVKGEQDAMVRTVAQAMDAGITYFDTARSYGDGASERSLGMALHALNADVLVGTKVDLRTHEMDDIEGSMFRIWPSSALEMRSRRNAVRAAFSPPSRAACAGCSAKPST